MLTTPKVILANHEGSLCGLLLFPCSAQPARTPGLVLVTTEFVLIELADALCKPPQREEVLTLWDLVKNDRTFRLVPASSDLLESAKKLYRERPDKEWPLTGCSRIMRHTVRASGTDLREKFLPLERNISSGIV